MNPLFVIRVLTVRKVAEYLTLALTFFFCASAAFAHAHLERSEPRANATLKQAPKTVELWFSEELEPSMSTVVVSDQTGKHVDKSNVSAAEGDRKLQIDLEELTPGTYTVDWKVLSTDQHTMKGKFTFTLAQSKNAATSPTVFPSGIQKTKQPPPPQSMAASQESPPNESMEESGTSLSMSVVRWLQYLAMMLLFGGFAFRLLVLGPSLRQAEDLEINQKATALENSAQRFIQLSWLSIVVLALTGITALVLQTAAILDVSVGAAFSPSNLSQVFTKTSYGAPWLLQLVAVISLVVILSLLSSSHGSQRMAVGHAARREAATANTGLMWAGLVVSSLIMLSPSLIGHAVAASSEYHLTIFSDWLHIVAAGFWVGGLFHLALTMTRALHGLEGQQRVRVLRHAIPLFTRLAIASTIVIALTGVYNSWIHVDRFSALWTTSYGEALAIKILLFIPMMALGGLNTFILHPRAKRLIKSDRGEGSHEHARMDSSFFRSVGIEAALGIAVLLVAAVLVFLQPVRHHGMTMSGVTTTSSEALAR